MQARQLCLTPWRSLSIVCSKIQFLILLITRKTLNFMRDVWLKQKKKARLKRLNVTERNVNTIKNVARISGEL